MNVPKVHGIIGRRLLVNFRVEPDVIQRQLPAPFRPKLHDGHAVAGICLIRLEDIRPKRFPRMLGLSSENAAHRIAVVWDDEKGSHEGVYIPRRDTGSLMNHLAGGRLFPGEHQRASFRVEDADDQISLEMQSADGRVRVEVAGRTSETLPPASIFGTVAAASAFFEPGSVGKVFSSYFADHTRFPAGTIVFDCGLIMRNIAHERRARLAGAQTATRHRPLSWASAAMPRAVPMPGRW